MVKTAFQNAAAAAATATLLAATAMFLLRKKQEKEQEQEQEKKQEVEYQTGWELVGHVWVWWGVQGNKWTQSTGWKDGMRVKEKSSWRR